MLFKTTLHNIGKDLKANKDLYRVKNVRVISLMLLVYANNIALGVNSLLY